MTEAAAQLGERVRCNYCGSLQEPTADPSATLCEACGQVMTTSPSPTIRNISLARSQAALEDLVRAPSEPQAPGMIEDILAFERRTRWGAAFIPFLGPWLVWNGGGTPRESSRLRAVSIVITGVTVASLFLLLPVIGIRFTSTQERVTSEIRALGEIAEAYRAEHGYYPDTDVWRRTADLPDSRFFDPWGRRYEYRPSRRRRFHWNIRRRRRHRRYGRRHRHFRDLPRPTRQLSARRLQPQRPRAYAPLLLGERSIG